MGVYGQLGELLAKGNGAAGKLELDSMKTVQKAYWRIFWEQADIADSLLTPSQKEFFPMLPRMAATTKKERENSRWQFGHSVKIPPAKPKAVPAAAAGTGATPTTAPAATPATSPPPTP